MIDALPTISNAIIKGIMESDANAFAPFQQASRY